MVAINDTHDRRIPLCMKRPLRRIARSTAGGPFLLIRLATKVERVVLNALVPSRNSQVSLASSRTRISTSRYGRGNGVGRGRGVGVGLPTGVGVTVDVAVGVGDGVTEGVEVGVAVGVTVGVGVGLAGAAARPDN